MPCCMYGGRSKNVEGILLIDCISLLQITTGKNRAGGRRPLTLILVGFEIQDNLATNDTQPRRLDPTKGQLISERLFVVFNFPKIQRKNQKGFLHVSFLMVEKFNGFPFLVNQQIFLVKSDSYRRDIRSHHFS